MLILPPALVFKKNLYTVLLCSVFAVSGCATSTLNASDSSKFSNYEPDAFFQQRFVAEEKSAFIGALSSGVNSWNRATDSFLKPASQAAKQSVEFDEKTTGLMQDGKTILYKAAFTNMNYAQLLRPSREAQTYCNATGRKLVAVKTNKANFPSKFFASPSEAFAEAMNQTYSGKVGITVAGVTVTNDLNNYKTIIAQHEADQVNMRNVMYDRDGAIKGYQAAADKNSFGMYECQGGDGTRKNWRVTILPFSFEPRDPTNQLIPHILKIMIVPEYI